MPAQQISYYNFGAGSVSAVGVTETVIGTSRAVSSSYPGVLFAVIFTLVFTLGATMTSVILNIRRSSLTGTSVFTSAAFNAAAASIMSLSAACTDQQAGELASTVYVLTATQAGGAGNGAATNVFSEVTVGL